MKERRKKIMKRLVIEELERRQMLAASEIAMASTGLTNNSVEDFYRSQVGTEAGGAAGTGMFDNDIGPMAGTPRFSTAAANPGNPVSSYPDATTGVGQMTITTGANTPGIGSFAMPTAGPSRAGGTGNANSPLASTAAADAAADAAIEALFADPNEPAVARQDQDPKPAEVTEQKTGDETMIGSKPTGRRAWDIAPDEPEPEKAAPVAAGAKR